MGRKTMSLEEYLAQEHGVSKPKEKSSNSYNIVSERKVNYTDKKPTRRNTSYNQNRGYNNRNNSRYNDKNNQGNRSNQESPTAPYNFVPLNDVVVHPPLYEYVKDFTEPKDIQQGYKKFLLDGKKYTGYLDVDIENITPLYIAGSNKKFFSDGKNLCIPGSSIRGCVHNIFKIITNASMRIGENPDVTDKILYFRNLAGKNTDPSKKLYAERFTTDISYTDKNGRIKTKKASKAGAGFLVRENKKYFICRAKLESKRGKSWEVTPNREAGIRWNNDYADIFTGTMNNKKHFYRVSSPVWKDKYIIPDDVLGGYKDDKNRKGLNLLDNKLAKKGTDRYKFLHGAENFDYIIPCFYVAEKGIVSHFGAGPYYRIPYQKSIGDHIPKSLKELSIDFADAIFGNKEHWSSRVYFEDCYLQNSEAALEKGDYSKILMGPNPTSFQFYLNVDKNKNPSTWDGSTDIRGYKFYWHRGVNWQGSKDENDEMNNFIAPVKANNHFKGKISFHDLDKTELGALLSVLDLCETHNCYYKIGMGKSIGLGSIKVIGKLYLRGEGYYKNLFTKDNNAFAQESAEQSKKDFIDQFDDYMKKQLSPESLQLYKTRLRDLQTILSMDYMNSNKADKWNNQLTRYMEIDNRKDRDIVTARVPLPTIQEVVKGLK